MNPVSARLLSQQLIVPQMKDPAEVVSWFGALQGQDYKALTGLRGWMHSNGIEIPDDEKYRIQELLGLNRNGKAVCPQGDSPFPACVRFLLPLYP
jgi:hypothetical protein